MKHFLSGVGITAAGLIAMTAATQLMELSPDFKAYGVVAVSTAALLTKKVPAPVLILVAAIAGFVL
jgi:chromate transporter